MMGMSNYIMSLEDEYVEAVERLVDQIDDAGALLLLMEDCKATKQCKCPRHTHLHQFMMRAAMAVGEFRKATQ